MNGLIDLKIKLEKIEKQIGIRNKGNKKNIARERFKQFKAGKRKD